MFCIDFSSLSNDQILSLANTELKSDLEDWEKIIWQFVADWFEHPDKNIEVFSSGSTGAPKLINHTEQAMLHSARMTCEALALKQGSTALLCLPATKISGMMMIVRCIQNKMKMYCAKPSLSPLTGVEDEGHIDFSSFTPAQFYEIIDSDKAFERAQSISKIILGGEEVRGVMKKRILLMVNEIYSTFGMTETISHIALKRLNGPKPDPFYKVLPGISVSSGENDCLVIEAPLLGQPHLQTNDIVRIINADEFEWLGRKDHVINSGGIKISPEQMESRLAAQITIPFFIGGLADGRLGERLVLMVEAKQLKPEELNSIKAAVMQVDKIYRPKEIRLVAELARTETGKIKRKESLQKKIFRRVEL